MNLNILRTLAVISLCLGGYAALLTAAFPSGSLGAILCALAAFGFFSVTGYTVYVETGKPE